MRTSFALKLAGIAALGVALSLATMSMMAQGRANAQKGKRAAGVVQQPHGGVGIRLEGEPKASQEAPTPDTGKAIAPTRGVPIPITPTAHFSRKSFAVESQGRDVVVDATLDMNDTRAESRFFWSLRVIDPQNKDAALFERVYADQEFTIPVDEVVSPTFNEHFRLGPGSYRVELSLSRTTPNEVADINNPAWLKSRRVLNMTQQIEIKR